MRTAEINVQIPETVAAEARKIGLFDPPVFENLIREEIRRRKVDRLFSAMDKLSSAPIPPMTPEEIEAEVAAARNQRRGSDASS